MSNIVDEVVSNIYNIGEISSTFWNNYKKKNSWKLRVIDLFSLYNFVLLVIQIFYMILVGTYPKNSFKLSIIA